MSSSCRRAIDRRDRFAFLDPFGNATHTALRIQCRRLRTCSSRAPGPIGITGGGHRAGHCGARHIVITDVNDYRLGLAAKMGASKALNVFAGIPGRRHAAIWASHGRRLRCGIRNVGQRHGAARNAAHHESRRAASPCSAFLRRRNGDRLEPSRFSKGLVIQVGASTDARCSRLGTRCRACCKGGLDVRLGVITHRLGINDYYGGFRDHEFREIRKDHPGLVQPIASERPIGVEAVSGRQAL